MNAKALTAEAVGTFAILAAFFSVGIFAAPPGTSIWSAAAAMGGATVALTYALGQISGGHFNPAITIGLVAGGRFDLAQAPWYIVAQLIGASLAIGFAMLLLAGSAKLPPEAIANLPNQVNMTSGTSMIAALVCEFVLTGILVMVFMGATAHASLTPHAPIAIGCYLALAYAVAIPLTNAGLNPARSTAAAIAGGAEHISILWMFWIIPILGACAGGLLTRHLYSDG